nr:alpha/beta hydrolase [Mycolicibacterium malmesburyense]CRL73865.1 peptidase S15 [Mycolicibacterium malmesburyense]
MPYSIERVSFGSGGTVIAGRLYRPNADSGPVPGVVLAHGFSATMDWIVPDFAATFAEGGLAALIFDYRHLGRSGGEPRQLIDSQRQREDLRNAVAFLRLRPEVDHSHVALWGTSLGGAHVIEVAAADPSITAVVANVPAIDMFRGIRGRHVPAHMRLGVARLCKATASLMWAASVDTVRGVLRLQPSYIPVYGRLGHAVFWDPSLATLFGDLESHSLTWRNEITPRFLFKAPRYRQRQLQRLTAPLLVTVARDDEVISTRFIEKAVADAPRYEVHQYPVRHFEMYHGAVRDQLAADHLRFLQRHLTKSSSVCQHGDLRPSMGAGIVDSSAQATERRADIECSVLNRNCERGFR